VLLAGDARWRVVAVVERQDDVGGHWVNATGTELTALTYRVGGQSPSVAEQTERAHQRNDCRRMTEVE